MLAFLRQPVYILPFLNPGRLVEVKDGPQDFGWGVIVNFTKKRVTENSAVALDGSSFAYIIDVVLKCATGTGAGLAQAKSERRTFGKSKKSLAEKPVPAPSGDPGEYYVVPVKLSLLTKLSSVRLHIPKDLRTPEARKSVGKDIGRVRKKFPDGLPLLDPIEDMKISDAQFAGLIRKIESLEDRIVSHRLHESKELESKMKLINGRLQVEEEIGKVKTEIRNCSHDTVMKGTLRNMKRVLRRLGMCTKENVITAKGRVACEISTCDELLATELMFSGAFNDLPVENLCALVSCLVATEKTELKVKLKEDMNECLNKLTGCAERIATVITDARIPIEKAEYVGQFKPNLMDVVFHWCKGAKFADICKLTDIFEGTIIRAMRRLEELLRQLSAAAKAIGHSELEAKFTEGIALIKRDIVFAASLYL